MPRRQVLRGWVFVRDQLQQWHLEHGKRDGRGRVRRVSGTQLLSGRDLCARGMPRRELLWAWECVARVVPRGDLEWRRKRFNGRGMHAMPPRDVERCARRGECGGVPGVRRRDVEPGAGGDNLRGVPPRKVLHSW